MICWVWFFFFLTFIFIYLAAQNLTCGMWDLVPWPGIEPSPPESGVQSLSHWTTREFPVECFIHSCLFNHVHCFSVGLKYFIMITFEICYEMCLQEWVSILYVSEAWRWWREPVFPEQTMLLQRKMIEGESEPWIKKNLFI